MMFKLLGIAACLVVAQAAHLKWSDCGTGRTALTVHDIDIRPNPVVFPGEMHFDINMTVNLKIDLLFVDIELHKITSFGEATIPCIGDTNIGTCKNIDACSILPRIRNGSSVVSTDLGLQIDKLLLTALGHQGTCPIQPETIILHNERIQLQPIPGALAAIASGDYRVTMKIKDDPTSDDNIGCMTLEAGVRRKDDPIVGR
ncbi:uncharacterized protein LOC127881873 [Dreissena polymorpha]|uniref:MD-2-related lipid-recognition domain-containing protein n=1 Tax=Dreissena polymorpha TaxID=45954 RepID=A0A9D4H6J8_DREPO|nr:uncharacterized protein LOC127881873 [Dreissena polymorpha]KAH3829508.1 hypothetical protein DPMN_131504 [Dreissena polymorpha]